MHSKHTLTSLLACPQCQVEDANQLVADANGWHCELCATKYPNLASIPFLWRSPQSAQLDWHNRIDLMFAEIESQQHHLQLQTERHALISSIGEDADAGDDADAGEDAGVTEKREQLARLQRAWHQHKEDLQQLLRPFHNGNPLARELHTALGTQLPDHHGLLSYAPQIMRDWCWGEDENKIVAEYLIEQIDAYTSNKGPLTKILVLGSGAGRLAYDLHRHYNPARTYAVDSNPLLCLLGQQMSAGKVLNFTEFPRAPINRNGLAVRQVLKAPAPISGIEFVCADAMHPPFGGEVFDLILTPWLIDVIDAPLADLAHIIRRHLHPDGLWINHGSLAFNPTQPHLAFTQEDVISTCQRVGFEILRTDNCNLPYLQSPHERGQRNELVFTLVASIKSDALQKPKPPHHFLPDWWRNTNLPVPLTHSFQTQITSTRVHGFIMSLIDGKRSIAGMAEVLEEQRLMPRDQAEEAIRGFLRRMQETSAAENGHQQS